VSLKTNTQVVLSSRPSGFPEQNNFEVVNVSMPEPEEGQMLVEILWLSLDPYMRGRMNDVKSYAVPAKIGEVMIGGTVGRVLRSRTPRFSSGDIVEGPLGWQTHAVTDGIGIRKVNESVAPVQANLGILGMPGMTAYFGFLDVCEPIPGDTVVVSAASGAVGQVVGQIAKVMGCRVIGTAGSDDKVNYIVQELGFDAGINYKTQNVGEALRNLCPYGIDVYFDNVGGLVTDAVLELINVGARIAICGQISQYNLKEPEQAPRSLSLLIRSQAKIQGFLVFSYENRYQEARDRIARWIDEGKLRYKEDVVVGLANAPEAFIGMLKGRNFGKALVKVAD